MSNELDARQAESEGRGRDPVSEDAANVFRRGRGCCGTGRVVASATVLWSSFDAVLWLPLASAILQGREKFAQLLRKSLAREPSQTRQRRHASRLRGPFHLVSDGNTPDSLSLSTLLLHPSAIMRLSHYYLLAHLMHTSPRFRRLRCIVLLTSCQPWPHCSRNVKAWTLNLPSGAPKPNRRASGRAGAAPGSRGSGPDRSPCAL